MPLERGQMKDHDVQKIKKIYVRLKRDVDPKDLIDYFVQEDLIDISEKEDVMCYNPNTKENRWLGFEKLLFSCGPRACSVLLLALKKTGYKALAAEIEQESSETAEGPSERASAANLPASIKDSPFRRMKETLLEGYRSITSVQLSPFDENETGPLEDFYVDVSIDKHKSRSEQSHTELTLRQDELDENHRKVAFKEKVRSYQQIFSLSNKRLYLRGLGGTGKTTYMRKIVSDWCNIHSSGNYADRLSESAIQDRLPLAHYELLFYVNFSRYNGENCIIDMLYSQCPITEEECPKSALTTIFIENPDRVLIILDAFDEFYSTPSFMSDILWRRLYPRVTFFTSLRPWKLLEMNLRQETHIDVLLDIEGFDEENAIKFARFVLHRYYRDNESSEDLKRSLQESKIMSSFKSNPLLLLFLVHVWYRNKSLPNQYHELYIQILDCLVERFIRKANKKQALSALQFPHLFGRSGSKLTSLQSTLLVRTFGYPFLKSLCRTAHHFLLHAEETATLIITKEELLKELGTMDENVFNLLLEIGILSKSDSLSPLNKLISVSFLHATIQEFLASVFLILEKRSLDRFLAALNSLDDILRNENIIIFLCGLHPKSGRKMFKRICEVCDTDPEVRRYRDNNDEIIKQRIENLNKIHRTCLNTTRKRFPLNMTDFRVKPFENVDALSSTSKCLENIKSLCIVGGRQIYSLMSKLNMKRIEHLSLNYVQLLSGNVNLSTSRNLRYLKLQSVTSNTKIESLLKSITKCKNLNELCLKDMSMHGLILDLTKLRNLTTLRLEGLKGLSTECNETICRSISNCLQLRTLRLLDNTTRSFFPDLSNLSQLTDFALGPASSIDGSGQAVCRQLANCRQMRVLVLKDISFQDCLLNFDTLNHITEINLTSLRMNDDCCIALCSSLLECIQLKSLWLKETALKNGVLDFSRLTELTYLVLWSVSISSECSANLCRTLASCTSLETLDFDLLNLHKAVLDMSSLTKLNKLNLSKLTMTSSCHQNILNSLSKCTQLRFQYVSWTKIHDEN